MVDTMYAAPGIGLAAPQVGVPLRVCVIDLSVGKRGGELLTLVNPEFVERDGMQLEEEGCLSVPGFNATVARPSRAVVRALDRDGATRRSSKARACWRGRSSTRSITSTACCSSIGCAASSATSSSARSASSDAPDAGNARCASCFSARRRLPCRRSRRSLASAHRSSAS